MTGAGEGSRWLFDRLGFRLALLLSLAILPIGLIAVAQSFRTSEEVRLRSEAALLGEVSRSVAVEQRLIQTAFGAATALGHAVLPLLDDDARCREVLADFVASSQNYVFAGFIETSGRMGCASSGDEINFRDSDIFRRALAQPIPSVRLNRKGAVTGRPVLIVTRPIEVEGELQGFLSISLPHLGLEDAVISQAQPGSLDLISFNSEGVVLSAGRGLADAEARLPEGIEIESLVGQAAQAFTGRNRRGEPRVFAVAPVVGGEVYAIGSWPPSASYSRPEARIAAVLAFPALMWLACILVAYFAVDRLVIGHLRKLRSGMRRFALGRRDMEPVDLEGAPREIRDIGETFERMRLVITRDEAELEDAVREREILLREVHHRVKNNLQLISSIINMQVRGTDSPEAARLLRRVQDRVMSLATIHRTLYQSSNLADLRVDGLVHELVNQHLAMGSDPGSNIAVETRLDPLTLAPDAAVSLSLATSEAVTNALKYLGTPGGRGRPWIRVTLDASEGGQARLVVANSLGPGLESAQQPAGTGLGGQLIDAFAAQLGATAVRERAPDAYRIEIAFPVDAETAEHAPDAPAIAV